jgi:lysophospholipase L1-like esterase
MTKDVRLCILISISTLLVIILLDLGLRYARIVPPDDPQLFFLKSYEARFSPFIESPPGRLTIKPDWLYNDKIDRTTDGTLPGRAFLYPGFRFSSFAIEKPQNTIRIFVFGGSTTFGLYVGAEEAFPALIQKKLASMYPRHNVEVINLGCPGMESTRVRILLSKVLEYKPDLLLVCSGHNEMLQGDTELTSRFRNNFRGKLLTCSILARWANYWGSSLFRTDTRKLVNEERAALETGLLPVYFPERLPMGTWRLPSKAFLESASRRFSDNITAMVASARQANVPIEFILPVSNLFYPPAISMHKEGFRQGESFDALGEKALKAYSSGRFEQALVYVQDAIGLSPVYAGTWYLRGLVDLKLGNKPDALADLEKARDQDVRTHRLTSRLQSVLIENAKIQGFPLVDPRSLFYGDLGAESAAAYFFDHLHPTRKGHQLIAEQVVTALPALLKLKE